MAYPTIEDQLYKDFMSLPSNMIAEIWNGKLVASALPAPRENYALSVLGATLGSAVRSQKNIINRWLILNKPEIHLEKDIVVPMIAGWKRENMQALPETAYFETPPDWVCEVLSPSTASYDSKCIQKSENRFSDQNARIKTEKRDIYAVHKVLHLWFIDPEARTLEAFELRDGQWVLLKTYGHEVMVDAAPFAAVPFELGALWFD